MPCPGAFESYFLEREGVNLESLTGDTRQRKSLEAGMQVTAEIHQGQRSIMEYLLSPVQKVVAEAGRER
jgi:HlyD family secretion protein